MSAGKSTFCRILSKLGAYVLIADEIAHQLLDSDEYVRREVISLFGNDVVIDGRIDRKRVAEKAFLQKDLLQKLERIIHPKIKNCIQQEYHNVCKEGQYPWFVVECPLLGSLGLTEWFDDIVHVTSDRALCLERAHQSGYTQMQYDQRMQYLPYNATANATLTITNNGTIQELTQKAEKFLHQL